MAEIREINLLVYPFWDVEAGKKLENKWKKAIEACGKNPESIFVIASARYSAFEVPGKNTRDNKEQELIEFASGKIPEKRLLVDYREFFPALQGFIKSNNLEFGNEIAIKAFGQHAGLCVQNFKEGLLKALTRICPGKKFKVKEIRAKSAKIMEEAIEHILRKANPRLISAMTEIELNRTIGHLTKSIQKGRITGLQAMHLVKESGNMPDFLAAVQSKKIDNIAGLSKRLRKRIARK